MKSYFYGLLLLLLMPCQAFSEDYDIDIEGAHAFIDFRIQHLGFSWMSGRFNTFTGNFSYNDNNPAKVRVEVDIDVASIDTNHAERDKHLRGAKFLDTDAFPKASFKSTSFVTKQDGPILLNGELTLHGVTKAITLDVEHVGHGNDPWGGYRRGFVATTKFKISDYAIDVTKLGPSSQVIHMTLSLEGIRRSITDKAEADKPF